MMLASLETKPKELMTTSLIRARMCELLAQQLGYKDSGTHFTVGLFSTLDAFLDCHLDEALQLLPFSREIREALLDYSGTLGAVLKQVQLYEQGDWRTLKGLRADSGSMGDAYLDAIEFGENLTQQLDGFRGTETTGVRPN
jgi:c-di-GMP phosphodiesterase